jgi:hypothetical protein
MLTATTWEGALVAQDTRPEEAPGTGHGRPSELAAEEAEERPLEVEDHENHRGWTQATCEWTRSKD